MKEIKFTKMHGTGNDYIYLNCLDASPENPEKLAQQISNRHFGVGSDGLVLICKSTQADFQMRMFNSDGSEAEMCGNAVRCIGKYLFEKSLTAKTNITLETKAGIKVLDLNVVQNQVLSVKVDLGTPELNPRLIPVNLDLEEIINHPTQFKDQIFNITCVSMGNPHCIIYVNEIKDEHIHVWGPIIEKSPLFPKKINVEFVKVISRNSLAMRVWERGAGETLSCGTGAAAVCVASHLNGYTNRKIQISLLGGQLDLEWAENNHVFKSGPAEFICDGIYPY